MATAVAAVFAAELWAADFTIEPAQVLISGDFEQAQLVVTGQEAGREVDRTLEAEYSSSDEKVVRVVAPGRLLATGNGKAEITVSQQGQSQKVPVEVRGIGSSVSYMRSVVPIFSKAGCNAGACHASQYGKGGFKLSVFAFEPDNDHQAIVRDREGRRINPVEPNRSLVLLKPTAQVPHGGSQRIKKGSIDYQILATWIAQRAPGPQKDDPEVTAVDVFPRHRLARTSQKQQLRVVATYSDNTKRDVTPWALFDSVDEAVTVVDAQGKVTAVGRGQGPVMVRFGGQVDISMFVVPYTNEFELRDWKNNNFVDELAAAKFKELGLQPAPLCDDATFLRRAYLDAIGTVPSIEAARQFLASNDPNKRSKLIDQLLGLTGDPKQDIHGNAWSAYWALKWSDLIRSSSSNLGDQGMWALYNWVRESMRTNKPFDKFVSELVTAQGSVYMSGPANYYRIARNPPDLAETTSQLFLGIRLQCARCHHHPFEKYGQDDYYGLAAFFARVSTKNSQEFGLFGRESVVLVRSGGEVKHPRTGKVMPPTPLEGKPVDDPLDRRRPLAQWLTSKENKYFADNVVNRYMAYLMGTGLVEPVDDLRATNPPSNPELMDALAQHFVSNNFDIKQLVRVIMNSRLYQLQSTPTDANRADRRFYSHYYVKRIAAEPLLDAIDLVCGTRTKFKDLPLGTRAIELPDSEYPDYFLKTFGKPPRVITCECERVGDPNLAQTLHLLNGEVVSGKVSDKTGRLAALLKAKQPHEKIVEELYLAALSRPPHADELAATRKLLAESTSPQAFYEDLLWALLNSKDFLFVH